MDTFQEIREEMKELYMKFNGPIVIMFSGGKDSSLVLTEWWFALKELPKEQRTKPVHVICGDTMVETPLMTQYVKDTLEKIRKQAAIDELPIETHLINPKMNSRYYYKILGRGNLPPTPNSNKNRWCTSHLKLKPSQSIIEDIIKQAPIQLELDSSQNEAENEVSFRSYNVLMSLGVRNEESARRRGSIKKHAFGEDSKFAKHATYSSILCYHPVKFITNDELLFYFLELGTLPFGVTLEELERQYGTSFAECGLKHSDKQDESCGVSGSRSGCFVCPLAKPDDPMLIGLINEGYTDYQYLLDWKKLHISMRNDIRYREIKRRVQMNKHIKRMADKEIDQSDLFDLDEEQKNINYYRKYQRAVSEGYDPGGFTVEARRILLEALLYIQEKMKITLIEEDEIEAILQAWIDTNQYIVKRNELVPYFFQYEGPVEFDGKGKIKKENGSPIFFIDMELNKEEDNLMLFLKERQSITGRNLFCFPSFQEYEKEGVVWNKVTFVVANKAVHSREDAKKVVWEWLGWLDNNMTKKKFDEACHYLIVNAISDALINKYQRIQEKQERKHKKMQLSFEVVDKNNHIPVETADSGQLEFVY